MHSFDLWPNSETRKHFQTRHPPVRLLAHIKEYNKHGCQILLNFAIKSENETLLSKWTANYRQAVASEQVHVGKNGQRSKWQNIKTIRIKPLSDLLSHTTDCLFLAISMCARFSSQTWSASSVSFLLSFSLPLFLFFFVDAVITVSTVKWKFQATEPPHDKTNKMTVCPAKTQVSLGSAQSDQCFCCAFSG